ncbi:MAG: hypothetical protein NC222_06405 [Staphylococcus sp.]|nr:hypothetical protein [Staphylococcus sp.]
MWTRLIKTFEKKAGYGASLNFSNFELNFNGSIIELKEGQYGIIGSALNPNQIKIEKVDVYNSEEQYLGQLDGKYLTVTSADFDFSYQIDEAFDNGDTKLKVTDFEQKDLFAHIGNGKWTYDYLKSGITIEATSDNCLIDFENGYHSECGLTLTISTSEGFDTVIKQLLDSAEEDEVY